MNSNSRSIYQKETTLNIFKGLIWYSIVYCTILVLSLFSSSYTNFKFLEQASFRSNDEPWLPSGLSPQPMISQHFFGDFYLPFRFVNEANPYSPQNPFNNILPFGQIGYQILGLFPVNEAYFVYTLTLLIIMVFGMKRIFNKVGNFSSSESLTLSIFIVCFSFPIVTGLDRGANVIFVGALMSWFIALSLDRNGSTAKEFVMVAILAYTISAKIYLLPLLIFVWLFSSRKISTISFSAIILLNLISSYQFGGPYTVYQQLKFAFEAASASANPDLLFGGVNFSGLLSHALHALGYFPQNKVIIAGIGFIPGLVLICIIIWVSKQLNLRVPMILSLALCSFQYVAPVTYVYTGVWASISVALLLAMYKNGFSKNEKKVGLVLLFGVSSQLLPVHIVSEFRIVLPILWLVTILTVVLLTVIAKREPNDTTNFTEKVRRANQLR